MNLPSEARRELQSLARSRGLREAELARELLLEALARARREEFYRQVAAAQTPALRVRDVRIAAAFEAARTEKKR